MTLEDIYTELDQIADDLHFLEYCGKQYQTSNKAELLAACQERGLTVKKSDKKDTLLHILRKDYERKMEALDARATALQHEKAAIKTQIAAQLTESEQEAAHPVASPAPFNPEPFCQAVAMAVAAYIPPFEVCGSWEVDAHFQASRQLDKWQAAHPDVDIFPLVFGFFVDDGIEIEDFDLGEPGPREGEEEEDDLHPTHGPLPAWMYADEQEPYALSAQPMQQQCEQEQPRIIEKLASSIVVGDILYSKDSQGMIERGEVIRVEQADTQNTVLISYRLDGKSYTFPYDTDEPLNIFADEYVLPDLLTPEQRAQFDAIQAAIDNGTYQFEDEQQYRSDDKQPPIIDTLQAMLSERRDKPGQDMLLRLVQEYEDEGEGNDGLLFAYIKEAAQTLYEVYERVKPEQ